MMHREIINYIETIMKKRSSLIHLASRQRAKFEGWLKFELADYLISKGIEEVVLEAPYSKMRSDIGFVYNNRKYYLELKTSNTNYRIKGIESKTRPITKNINSIIEDAQKLKECGEIGLVCFILFPIPINDNKFMNYLERVGEATDVELERNEHYKVVNMGNHEIVVCCFEVIKSGCIAK